MVVERDFRIVETDGEDAGAVLCVATSLVEGLSDGAVWVVGVGDAVVTLGVDMDTELD